jgi:hypothetical protein
MALAVPRQCLKLAGFSPCCLSFCPIGEAIGTLSDESASPAFTGFCAMESRYSSKLCRSSTRTSESPRCQTSLKYSNSFLNRKGKSALDELHGPFDRHLAANCDQMRMVRHHDEMMELEFARPRIGTQHVNEQHCIAFRLEQGPPHARLRGNEKGTRGAQDLASVGMAGWSCHNQGLKPDSFRRISGTAKAMP